MQVGQKVKVKSRAWVGVQEKDSEGDITRRSETGKLISFVDAMWQFCGRELTVEAFVENGWFTVVEDPDGDKWVWAPWMFEGYE